MKVTVTGRWGLQSREQTITPKTEEARLIRNALIQGNAVRIVDMDYSGIERRCLTHDKPEEFTK